MSYEQIKDLRSADFKPYCGVEAETFRRMVEVVAQRLAKKRRKTGCPPKLTVEEQVLLPLEIGASIARSFISPRVGGCTNRTSAAISGGWKICGWKIF